MIRSCLVFALLALGSAHVPNYAMLWKSFKDQFKKAFTGAEEEALRFEIFRRNVDHVYEWNAKNVSFQLGVNEFAHMSPDEFYSRHLGFMPENLWGTLPRLGTHMYSGAPLADSVDWDAKGAVTPVKNQASCGSCWSFSATGALEGAWQIATGKLVSLSEQQFVDCDKVDQGCNGGAMENAFAYAEKNAICTEDSYSYHPVQGTCKASSCTVGIPKGGVTGFKDVTPSSLSAMMEAVSQHPVSIAIEADKMVFQLYKSGVLSGDCGTKLDHGVLAVGYGTLNGQKYWKVKNSWGPTWGMNGYVNILRGDSDGAGMCGLLSQPSYPIVNGKAPPGPAPGPGPAPEPGPSGTPHYEKPPCQADEVQASVQGAGGSVCAPPCDGNSCPTDTPPGTKAKPQCILQDSASGAKYCALTCITPGTCPTGAKCAQIPGGTAICVYPGQSEVESLPIKLGLAWPIPPGTRPEDILEVDSGMDDADDDDSEPIISV